MTETLIAELEGLIAQLDEALTQIQHEEDFIPVGRIRGPIESARTIANRLRNQAVMARS